LEADAKKLGMATEFLDRRPAARREVRLHHTGEALGNGIRSGSRIFYGVDFEPFFTAAPFWRSSCLKINLLARAEVESKFLIASKN